jgi:GntR family transcriptional repressor for pyruvate dehydrogenase complex
MFNNLGEPLMPEFRSIAKPPSIPEVVLEEIQRLISEGELRPGDRLPSETELAERFGVGRSSIREAMRVLHLLGVIEVIQGKGTFVRQPGILPLMIDWSRIAQMGIIAEVMEARQFIEILLAQLAAERATEEDIEALGATLERERGSTADLEADAQAGVDFHMALADAVHNRVLALMYRTIHDLFLETARRMRATPETARDRLQDHERIFQAIQARDPEAAAQAMREHLEKAYKILMESELEETQP